jgi:murein DD-endopeptidase MepM/ murein hydrolase activator NlpD
VPRPLRWTAAGAVLAGLLLGGAPALAAGEQRADWVWPLAGTPQVARGFEPPPQRWAAGHRGVDLLALAGAVVRSAGAGSVTFAGSLAGRGVVVVAHADGTRTTYEPVVATVQRGDQVGVGQALGRLTVVGGHCLPLACLHWGRRRGEVYLDPMLLLRPGPARLLPVWAGAQDRRPAEWSARPPVRTGPAIPPDATRSAPRWQLVAGTATGLPLVTALAVLALLVVLVVTRRRRPHSRAGSSAASNA